MLQICLLLQDRGSVNIYLTDTSQDLIFLAAKWKKNPSIWKDSLGIVLQAISVLCPRIWLPSLRFQQQREKLAFLSSKKFSKTGFQQIHAPAPDSSGCKGTSSETEEPDTPVTPDIWKSWTDSVMVAAEDTQHLTQLDPQWAKFAGKERHFSVLLLNRLLWSAILYLKY